MVKVKQAQEYSKNQSGDLREWERTRQRAFSQYTVSNEDHSKKLTATVDELGDYFPIEAYRLRHLFWNYDFIKTRKLDHFVPMPNAYLAMIGSYETSYLVYQYELELIIRFLAFRQSKWLWLRIRYQLWRLRRVTPKGDIIFIQQLKSFRSIFKKFRIPRAGQNSVSEIVAKVMSAAEIDATPADSTVKTSSPASQQTRDPAA